MPTTNAGTFTTAKKYVGVSTETSKSAPAHLSRPRPASQDSAAAAVSSSFTASEQKLSPDDDSCSLDLATAWPASKRAVRD